VYLAVEEAAKKWTFHHRDRAMIYSLLIIYFGDHLGETCLNAEKGFTQNI
jgi:hypothetical protein